MAIEKLTNEAEYPWELLMDADPNKEFVLAYLKSGSTFIYRDDQGTILGVIVIKQQEPVLYEVMNLAVAPAAQNKGIGRQLLDYVLAEISKQPLVTSVVIKTGDLPSPALTLYQNAGFKKRQIVKDYFLEHYPEPIFESGQQLRHQLILEQTLHQAT